MKTPPPKHVWINGVNLSGLWFPEPRRAAYDKDLNCWWTGDFDAQKLGWDDRHGCIVWASESKAEATIWTWGVLSMIDILSDTACYWTKDRRRKT